MIELTALHVWPRSHCLFVSHPNRDGSHTLTLFLPFEGEDSFDTVRTPEQISALIGKYFPDLVRKGDQVYVFDGVKLGLDWRVDSSPSALSAFRSWVDDPYYATSGAWGQSFGDLWGLHLVDVNLDAPLGRPDAGDVGPIDAGITRTLETSSSPSAIWSPQTWIR